MPTSPRYIGKISPIFVNTIQDLRDFPIVSEPKIPDYVSVRGYYAIGDGGGGPVRSWVSGATPGTYVDNGGSVIVPTGGNGSSAWTYAIGRVLYLSDFGLKADGTTDDGPVINIAIRTAQLAKANSLTQDEIYQFELVFPDSKDVKIATSIVIPSATKLNLNGCRLLGDGSGTLNAYNPSGLSVIRTGYWNPTTKVVTAHDPTTQNETTNRLIAAVIENGTIQNANCGIDACNMQENSEIRNLRFTGCSAPMRIKGSFYLNVKNVTIRNSSQYSGQESVRIYGDGCNNMSLREIRCVNVSVGFRVVAPTSLAVTVESCSFEEGYASNSIGILFDTGYGQAWNIKSCYFEGVRKGIYLNAMNLYGATFVGNYFSSTEYSLQSSLANGVRVSDWFGNSFPADGAGINNILDVSPFGNDLRIGMQSKGGNALVGYLGNVLASPDCTVHASSSWKSSTVLYAKAMSDGAGNKDSLVPMPFEGRSQVSHPTNPVFADYSFNATSITVTTGLIHDARNILAYNFEIADNVGTYNLYGLVFGQTVHELGTSGKTIVFTGAVGSPLVATVAGLDWGLSQVINTSGHVRHV